MIRMGWWCKCAHCELVKQCFGGTLILNFHINVGIVTIKVRLLREVCSNDVHRLFGLLSLRISCSVEV